MQVRDSEIVIMAMFSLMTKKSSIISSGGALTLIDEKIIKSPFNKNNVRTIKNKQNSNK